MAKKLATYFSPGFKFHICHRSAVALIDGIRNLLSLGESRCYPETFSTRRTPTVELLGYSATGVKEMYPDSGIRSDHRNL
jgi:hypothetical protein